MKPLKGAFIEAVANLHTSHQEKLYLCFQDTTQKRVLLLSLEALLHSCTEK